MTTELTLPKGWRENPVLAEQVLGTLRAASNARIERRQFASPGELAKALDPATKQTPALDLIDAALVDVAEGRETRLIISMPPQEGKSERTTHYGALWFMYRNPNLRIGIVSYGDDIAGQFSYKIRTDITVFDGSDGNVDLGMHLQRDSKAASRWQLAYPAKGGAIAVGIGSALTGRPIDALFIDDPVKDFKAADSQLQSEQAWSWWQSVARPRLAPGAPVILILTRWSETDLAGRLLAKQAEDEKNIEATGQTDFDRWRVVNIPAQADHNPELGQTDPLGRNPGEFMVSARGRTEAQWRATIAATAPRIWTALYQGKPSPDAGDVWKRTWWRRYDTPLWSMAADGIAYEIDCDELLMSWDLAFKDTKSSDFVVGQVWARRGANVYLVDQIRRRLSFTDTVTALQTMRTRWPQAKAILIEDKANGPAVINSLKDKVPGIIPVTPHDSKYARATAVSPFIQAGNVHLPSGDAQLGETNSESLIEEAAAFPNGGHDDMVDTTSQALARFFLEGLGAVAWIEWLDKRVKSGEPIRTPDEILADADAEFLASLPPERRAHVEAMARLAAGPIGPPGGARVVEPELTDAEKLKAARDANHRK